MQEQDHRRRSRLPEERIERETGASPEIQIEELENQRENRPGQDEGKIRRTDPNRVLDERKAAVD